MGLSRARAYVCAGGQGGRTHISEPLSRYVGGRIFSSVGMEASMLSIALNAAVMKMAATSVRTPW